MNIKLNIYEKEINSDLPATLTVTVGDTTAHLYGEVEFIADYTNLSLLKADNTYVAEILNNFCKSDILPNAVDPLTEIVGAYLIVIVRNDQLYIYKSDDVSFNVFYATIDNGIILATQFEEIVKAISNVRLVPEDFDFFLKRGQLMGNGTLIDGINLVLPYSLYIIKNQTLALITHSFPGLHTVLQNYRYTLDDYFTAIAAYKPHFPSFTIAYSGGVDSRIIADLYSDKVSELASGVFSKPYLSLSRQAESKMAEIAAQHWNVSHTNIEIDYEDTKTTQKYLEHYVLSLPHTAFQAPHMYGLVKATKSSIILNGQAADNLWDWGNHQMFFTRPRQISTTGRTVTAVLRRAISRMFQSIHVRSNFKSSSRLILNTFISRYAMIKSFDKLVYPQIIYNQRVYSAEFDGMRHYPYKMFILGRYRDYCGHGETLSWIVAAKYFNKRVISPYMNPIALHVNSHIKRTNFMDLKAPFRSYLAELQPHLPKKEETEHLPHFLESSAFDVEEDFDWEYDFVDPAIQQQLKSLAQNQGIHPIQKNTYTLRHRVVLKHLKILFDSLEKL